MHGRFVFVGPTKQLVSSVGLLSVNWFLEYFLVSFFVVCLHFHFYFTRTMLPEMKRLIELTD